MAPAYPTSVDTVTARVTAAQVSALALVSTVVWPLSVLLAVDLALRAIVGPSRAPLSRLAAALRPHVRARAEQTPASPKRFAAAMGASLASAAVVAHLVHQPVAAQVLCALLSLFAFAEAAAGWCIGCVIHQKLVTAGVVRQPVCDRCVGQRDVLDPDRV